MFKIIVSIGYIHMNAFCRCFHPQETAFFASLFLHPNKIYSYSLAGETFPVALLFIYLFIACLKITNLHAELDLSLQS